MVDLLSLAVCRGKGSVHETPAKLFFDEEIGVRVVLAKPDGVDVHLHATVVTTLASDNFTIFEDTLNEKDARSTDAGLEWIPRVHIKHSRGRDDAFLELTAVAVKRRQPETSPQKSQFLPSLVPVGSSFFSDLDFVTPGTEVAESQSTLKLHGKEPLDFDDEVGRAFLKFPLQSVLAMGLRCVRPLLEKDRLLSQLDVVSKGQRLNITELKVTLYQGVVIPISKLFLPLVVGPGGWHSLAYNLQTLVAASNGVSTEVTVTMAYEVVLQPTECAVPIVKTTWVTTVDFQDTSGPLPRTPVLGLAPSPSMPRHNSSVSLASMGSSLSESGRTRAALGGVTIFLTGPNYVDLGQIFEWQLTVFNRSSRTRKLVLSFQSRDQYQPPLPRPTDRALVADPVTLQRRVEAYQASLGGDNGVIPLSNEVRIGQLAGHSCFEARVCLLALSPGKHSVEGSTVIDLATGDMYDVGELLEVVVRDSPRL